MSTNQTTDVLIIGAGIIGVSTAYYLAKAGIPVTVCEKGNVGGEQSSRNWGFVRTAMRHQDEIPMCIESIRLFNDFKNETGFDTGFRQSGTLYLSETQAQHDAHENWITQSSQFDVGSQLLAPNQIKRMVPDCTVSPISAMYTASDGCAEPTLTMESLKQAATNAGVVIHENCAVRGLDIQAGKVSGVITEHGRITAPTVVNSGGVWASYFSRNHAIDFPQLKIKSSIYRTHPCQNMTDTAFKCDELAIRRRNDKSYSVAFAGDFECHITPDYFRYLSAYLPTFMAQRKSLKLHVGKAFMNELKFPNRWRFDEVTQFEKNRILSPEPNMKLLRKAQNNLARVFPKIANAGVAEAWAGMIDVMPDELPVICPIDQLPGYFLSTGYSAHGFGIGLGAGKATAEMVSGHTPFVDLSPFSIDRFKS